MILYYNTDIFIERDNISDSSKNEEISDNDSIPELDKTLCSQGTKYFKMSDIFTILNLKSS